MSELPILHEVEILEVRRIADLAAAARQARDWSLTPVAETEFGEPRPGRGEHDPGRALAFEGPGYMALRDAIEAMASDIRRKLWAVMRIGAGDYARGDWDDALAAATLLSDQAVAVELVQEVDLHDRLMKGLYETGGAEPWTPPA